MHARSVRRAAVCCTRDLHLHRVDHLLWTCQDTSVAFSNADSAEPGTARTQSRRAAGSKGAGCLHLMKRPHDADFELSYLAANVTAFDGREAINCLKLAI